LAGARALESSGQWAGLPGPPGSNLAICPSAECNVFTCLFAPRMLSHYSLILRLLYQISVKLCIIDESDIYLVLLRMQKKIQEKIEIG
jgi:hypothetical protein